MAAEQMEPVFGGAYGDSGTGKTGDAMFAFPDGFFIAQQGVIPKLARGLVGSTPKWKPVNTLEDAIALLNDAVKRNFRPSAFVIDDLSLLQQESVRLSKKSGYEMWRDVLNKILEIAYIARNKLNAHVWFTAHEQGSRVMHGTFIKGGPLLSGAAAAHLPKSMDVLLRVMPEEARPMWPFVFQSNNSDINFVTKDRNNVCADLAPMNTGEILRAAGYTIPRMKGLEWQDDVAKRVCDALQNAKSVEDRKKVITKADEFVYGKYSQDSRHVAWAIRDGIDRLTLLRTKNDPRRRLLSTIK